MTERTRLEEVLKEQKLGLSGAVDSKTAADIGKLMGAKLLVLGNVIQVGNYYQITSKLVNAESGEIITSEIVEVPVKTFDEDAERYLVLVPDQQTIGIQLLENVGMMKIDSGINRTFTTSDGGGPYIMQPDGFGENQPNLIGFVVRYYPVSWLVIEGAYYLPQNITGAGVDLVDQNGVDVGGGRGLGYEIDTQRYGAAYTGRLGQHIRFYTGLEILEVQIKATSPLIQDTRFLTQGYLQTDPGGSVVIPMARIGLEWKPQERFGFGVFSNISAGSKNFNRNVNIIGSTKTSLLNANVVKIEFPAVSVEGCITLYF